MTNKQTKLRWLRLAIAVGLGIHAIASRKREEKRSEGGNEKGRKKLEKMKRKKREQGVGD